MSDDDQVRALSDPVFKRERERQRNKASSQFWGKIFPTLQRLLREGSKTLPKDAQEKYFISVTHDEVNRGLLQNDKRDTQAIYFERTIANIDAEIASENSSNNAIASSYRDSIPIKNDAHGKREPDVESSTLLEEMKKACRDKMKSSVIVQNTVPWVADGALSKSNNQAPYLTSFGSKVISTVCESLFAAYTKPSMDALDVELVAQNNSVISKLQSTGFARDDTLQILHSYVQPSCPSDLAGKVVVLHGKSGMGKSWVMSKFIQELGTQHKEEDMTIFYRLLGTSSHSSDVLSLTRNLHLQYNAVLKPQQHQPPLLKDWEDAKSWMLEEMIKWPQERGTLVLVLDSIDQLSAGCMALDNMSNWIPGLKNILPDNVKVS